MLMDYTYLSRFLTLNCGQEIGEDISFLDVLVFRDENIWCTYTYVKREHLPPSRIDQKFTQIHPCFCRLDQNLALSHRRCHALEGSAYYCVSNIVLLFVERSAFSNCLPYFLIFCPHCLWLVTLYVVPRFGL